MHLPVLVPEPETGSVAIKTRPKAKLPITACQYHGTSNIGFVSEPTIFSRLDIVIIPMNVQRIILQDATLVANKIIKPMHIAIIDVSPIEPGIFPKNASIQVNLL